MPSGMSVFQQANPGINVARSTQTSVPPVSPNSPFNRQAPLQQQQGFQRSGLAFGSLVNQQLPAAGGYLRGLSLLITASGGSGTTTVTLAADAPWNILGNSIQFKDATGNPIVNVDSFSLYLINLFSGQCGQDGNQNPSILPSYSPPALGASGSGNFVLHLMLPLELDSSGYCSLSDQNATAQPTFQCTLVSSAQFYGVAPNTALPTIQIQCNMLYWGIPPGNPLAAPPDNGSSAQWTLTQGGQNPAGGAGVRVRHPSPGTAVHTLVAVLRDTNAARQNGFPTQDLTLWVDDFPRWNSMLLTELQDMTWKQFTIPTAVADQGSAANQVKTAGVIVFSFRTAVMAEVTAADTYDELLWTTPATKLEIGGTWGSAGSPPYTVNFLTGWLYPANPQRIPWTHLAA